MSTQELIIDKIKSFDLFGQTISLQFKKNGGTHSTFAGGAAGLIIKILMSIYVFMLIQKWLTFGDNTIRKSMSSNQIEDTSKVSFNSMNCNLMITLKKSSRRKNLKLADV